MLTEFQPSVTFRQALAEIRGQQTVSGFVDLSEYRLLLSNSELAALLHLSKTSYGQFFAKVHPDDLRRVLEIMTDMGLESVYAQENR